MFFFHGVLAANYWLRYYSAKNHFRILTIPFSSNITLVIQHAASQGNIASFLGIEYTHIVPDYLKAKIPVAPKTRQPQELLSGGDSVVLAEKVGIMAANLYVDQKKHYCLGLEINAHHIRRGEVCVRCSQTAPYR